MRIFPRDLRRFERDPRIWTSSARRGNGKK